MEIFENLPKSIITHAYLIGPAFDIKEVYLCFETGQCFWVDLKNNFQLLPHSEKEINRKQTLQIVKPEFAYEKLVKCDYEAYDNLVMQPEDLTISIVLSLLLDSV
jgi:hypothetical protein